MTADNPEHSGPDHTATHARRGFGTGALLGLFLAVGMVASALLVSSTARDVAPARDKVQVKGYAEKQVVSDMGVWTGRFTVRTAELPKAYAELQVAQQKVQAFLTAQGFKDGVEFTPVETSTIYRQDARGSMTSEVQAYELAQMAKVTSKDVARLNSLAREVSALIKDDVNLMSMPPQFYYTGLEAAKLDLLTAATVNARERAAALAKAGGSKVGSLLSARQGVFQVTPAISTEVADYGVYDLSTIDKTIKAVVTVEFAIH